MDKDSKILIVGLGVIGGSYAMGLSACGYTNVYGVDKDKDTIKRAINSKFIIDGSCDAKDFIKGVKLVVIALYPNQVVNFLKENIKFFDENTIICDVAGIKEHYVDKICEILPKGVDFIFCHPMAGREKKGIEYASEKVFQGANFIITKVDRNKEENILQIESLAREIGFNIIKRITPKAHDEIIAYTSQLPHAIAVALVNSDDKKRDTGSFIGDSYRDLTRIADINEDLWAELFLGNRDNLLKAIITFENELDKIKEAIISKDVNTLKDIFRSSAKTHAKLINSKR